ATSTRWARRGPRRPGAGRLVPRVPPGRDDSSRQERPRYRVLAERMAQHSPVHRLVAEDAARHLREVPVAEQWHRAQVARDGALLQPVGKAQDIGLVLQLVDREAVLVFRLGRTAGELPDRRCKRLGMFLVMPLELPREL